MKENKIKAFSKKLLFALVVAIVVGGCAVFVGFFLAVFYGTITTNSVFATGMLAIATFLLAAAAFWTIWQNHQFHARERKERFLREINDWATYGWSEVCYSDLDDWTEKRQGIDIDKLTNLISRSSNVLFKARYISGDLEKQVRAVLADLKRLAGDELKDDVKYKKLKGVEKAKYIKHIQDLLDKISDRLSDIMISSSEL